MKPEVNTDSNKQPQGKGHVRWWAVWLFTAMMAAVTPFLHYYWNLAELLETFRPTQLLPLLPAHLLFLKQLGEVSGLLFLGVIAMGIVAVLNRTKARMVIMASTLVILAFSVGYGSYCGLLIVTELSQQRKELKQELGIPNSTDTRTQNP